jgi:lipoprotein-releasing system permease protein
VSNLRPPATAPYRMVMALRLLRARWINLISIVGVMLGVGSIIVVLSVMDGFQRDLKTMIRGTLSDALVEIEPNAASSYRKIKAQLEEVPGIEAVTLQRHTFGALPASRRDAMGSRNNYIPVKVSGLIPEDEGDVSEVMDFMQILPESLEYFAELGVEPPDSAQATPDDPFVLVLNDNDPIIPEEWPRVAISEYLAHRLGTGWRPLRPKQEFDLISFEELEDEQGRRTYRPQTRKVVISRVFKSGNSEFDRGNIYVDLRGSGKIFFKNPEGTVCEFRMRLSDGVELRDMREPIARVLGEYDETIALDPTGTIQSWEDRQRSLLRAVQNEKFLLGFVLFFIVLVACFTIFATLTMTVVEKTREIGVLRALGATPGGILAVFMINGTLVGTFGAGLGYAGGIYVSKHVNGIRVFLRENFGWDIFPPDIYLFDEIPTYIDHAAGAQFAAAAALSALVFAIIPAFRASRLRPVKALRYE